MTPRALVVLASLAAFLAAVASSVGLLVPGFYARDPAILVPQMIGQDLVTLALVVPLLVLATLRRASYRARLLQAGALLYLAYTYATYAFATRFNALFLVYVAILGLSVYALFLAVPRALALPVPRTARLPRRSLAAFLLLCAAAFVLLWGMDVVPALLSGGTPRAALDSQTPTSPIHVLDLAIALPLLALSGALLLRRREAGVALAGMALVKAGTIAAAVLSMGAFASLAGERVDVPVASAMVVVLAAAVALGWRLFRALGPTDALRAGARPRPAAPPLR